ncbi:MAG: Mini-ribonuclease 3 [Clostridia bacterium]|nr:Mini-ribonuclease 3 [Clostridia bacterium]
MDLDLNLEANDVNPEFMNPLVWAYIGDAVYELYVRTHLVTRGPSKVNQLHCESIKYVKASAQADFARKITENLNEDEIRIMKRGRNTKSTVPKNADVADYRYSTGLESLLGYLYLQNKKERLMEILSMLDLEKEA